MRHAYHLTFEIGCCLSTDVEQSGWYLAGRRVKGRAELHGARRAEEASTGRSRTLDATGSLLASWQGVGGVLFTPDPLPARRGPGFGAEPRSTDWLCAARRIVCRCLEAEGGEHLEVFGRRPTVVLPRIERVGTAFDAQVLLSLIRRGLKKISALGTTS